ncbi:hypothetical protein AbraIFM66951_008255 [Aspergillus brasiliensis]|uniref:N-acetyltransferase domain-containing protein n=1 Tax=Aspergillus brasiliensis TaxID=319629 RepID=A0A9W5YNF4_9EURO|nr:hypothetical protein AbraCBS73388_006707 [Aspergillus brasiliensis]GKZ45590.1 hypothetical protein AbraIFM66951_008255 [Aspergillus brasiliensis]
MSSKSTVSLIPWDPESISHRRVLSEQRVECTWHQEKAEKEWRELQLRGAKFCAPIQDTALSINPVPRNPSHHSFIPIGHISLDSENPDTNESIQLDDIPTSHAYYWIKTFYVIQAVQSQNVGRAAMDQVEEMAVREPLNAVHAEDQLREEFALVTYGRVPKVANQVWYARRGYRLIRIVPNHYKDISDKNGKYWDTRTVVLRKDIA